MVVFGVQIYGVAFIEKFMWESGLCTNGSQLDLMHLSVNNKLKLNQEKTEFFVACSAHQYEHLQHLSLHLGDQQIPSSPSIRNLGVIFDHSLTMADHITSLSRSHKLAAPEP
jgi:hypothetical protein